MEGVRGERGMHGMMANERKRGEMASDSKGEDERRMEVETREEREV